MGKMEEPIGKMSLTNVPFTGPAGGQVMGELGSRSLVLEWEAPQAKRATKKQSAPQSNWGATSHTSGVGQTPDASGAAR